MVVRPVDVPHAPGCYQFLDQSGRVVYVGKAKDLHARLASYFPHDLGGLHPRTAAMLNEASSVSWVVLSSEEEALLVEASMIRRLLPAYNVRLREDHAYPSIVLSGHEFPRIMIRHAPPADAGAIYGPYPSPAHARDLFEAVSRVAGVRPCSDGVLARHVRLGRECLIGSTNRCAAPCVSPAGYGDKVSSAVALLSGSVAEAEVVLRDKMQSASSARAFEAAAAHRDALAAVVRLSNRSLPTASSSSIAAAAACCDDLGAAVQVLVVRDRVLVACPTFIVDRALLAHSGELSQKVALEYVLAVAFSDTLRPPSTIGVPVELSDTIQSALSSAAGRKVTLRHAKRGSLHDLVLLAQENAAQALSRARLSRASDATTRRAELVELANVVGLDAPPLRIECVDISHFQGADTTAAFAVVDDGVVQPRRHRVFHVDSGNDDVGSMGVAVRMRVAAYFAQQERPAVGRDVVLANLPQLFVVDGGRAQVDAVVAALAECGVSVPVVGLAKRLEEVFLPGRVAPLRLELDSPALYVLQRARDAAHAVSLKQQRRRRSRSQVVSKLDGVKGLGPKRRARLLAEFRSERRLAMLGRDAYPAWLPEAVADRVFLVFNPSAVEPGVSAQKGV